MCRSLPLLFLVACTPIDAGMMDDICGPIVVPLEVAAEPGIDVSDAIDMWTLGPLPLFVAAARWDECRDGCLGVVTVYRAQVGEGALGAAALAVRGGEVRACEVRLDDTWQVDTVVLAHELGHCLGLAHDDDDDSIMHSPTRPWAQPTQHDYDLALGGCDGE